MRSATIVILAAAAVFTLAACGGSEATTTTSQPTTTTTATAPTTTQPEIMLEVVPRSYAEFRAQQTACGAAAPEPVTPMQFDAPINPGIDSEATVTATMSTSCGDIEIELDPSLAPETVDSFILLATEGYFDGTVFHRVIPDFVAQGGDQTATGTGGPGYVIPDEFPPLAVTYSRGAVAMANSGPGTTGSQFFMMLEDGNLPPQYSIFGWVREGFEVLDLMQGVPLGQSATSPDPFPSTPLETIYIDAVTIQS